MRGVGSGVRRDARARCCVGGWARFDPDVRAAAVTGNTVVSSVNCGAADFAFGGAPVAMATAFAGLSPMMGLTHVVVGVGDTVTVGVHAAESALGALVGWTPTSPDSAAALSRRPASAQRGDADVERGLQIADVAGAHQDQDAALDPGEQRRRRQRRVDAGGDLALLLHGHAPPPRSRRATARSGST